MEHDVQGIPWETGKPLPVYPGDVFYSVESNGAYRIRRERVREVRLYEDGCYIIEGGEYEVGLKADPTPEELLDYYFPSRELAERWIAAHKNEGPVPLDEAIIWTDPDLFLPARDNQKAYVKVKTDLGVVKMDAVYSDDPAFPEDKGFWDGTGRHSKKLDNVIAWISFKSLDPEEGTGNEDLA